MNDSAGNTASWKEWLAAYVDAYESLPGPVGGGCPNCGAGTLNLVFTGLVEDRVGYASFWCSTCLFGIHLSRVAVPDGVPMDSVYTPVQERSADIPNYTVVREGTDADDDDGDVESFRF